MISPPTDNDFFPGYLDGQLLLAMPGMADERFARSVIYLCAHSAEGAMGIVLTRPAPDVNMPDLLVQLEIIPESERIRLPETVDVDAGADRRTGGDHPWFRASFAGFPHGFLDPANR